MPMMPQNGEFKILVLDVETTGMDDTDMIVQCGAILHDLPARQQLATTDTWVSGGTVPDATFFKEAGITQDKVDDGMTQQDLYAELLPLFSLANVLICHNADFDTRFIKALFEKHAGPEELLLYNSLPKLCTMKGLTDVIGLTNAGGLPKWPKLEEALDHYLPDYEFKSHDAFEDAKATLALFLAAFDAGDLELG
jgi:DNA polymerase III alpha subunit (gram-positive type)